MAIEKREGKDGKPQYRVRIAEHDAEGRRRNLTIGTFRTMKEAQREERDALHRRDRGTLMNPDTITVGELLDACLATMRHMGKVREQTAAGYAITIRKHLKPALGTIRVQKLTSTRVQSQYDTWHATGMSARTIKECHQRLSQALRYAKKHTIVYVNVCENVSPPSVPKAKPDVWDVDESMAFLDVAETDRLSPLWHLLLMEGMRRGEALGLRWGDVDMERGIAHIVQTVRAGIARGEAIIQPYTKTDAGSRSVRLTARTITSLQQHQDRQRFQQEAAGEAWADTDLIICTSKGTPFNPTNVRRYFDVLVKRAGVRRITPHGLRHTHATMLLRQGVPAKIVSERLGHASVGITLDRYSHLIGDMQDTAADAMDTLLKRESEPA